MSWLLMLLLDWFFNYFGSLWLLLCSLRSLSGIERGRKDIDISLINVDRISVELLTCLRDLSSASEGY